MRGVMASVLRVLERGPTRDAGDRPAGHGPLQCLDPLACEWCQERVWGTGTWQPMLRAHRAAGGPRPLEEPAELGAEDEAPDPEGDAWFAARAADDVAHQLTRAPAPPAFEADEDVPQQETA